MPLTDDFISVNNKDRNEYLGDIEIYICSNCKIIQNPNDFDHDDIMRIINIAQDILNLLKISCHYTPLS